jgi:hypothetical protein
MKDYRQEIFKHKIPERSEKEGSSRQIIVDKNTHTNTTIRTPLLVSAIRNRGETG